MTTNAIKDDERLPEHLLIVPGFVNELVQFCNKSSPYPNPILALCGSLALMSYLVSRKVKTQSGIRPNIYLVALAGSGTGKDYIRKVNTHLLQITGQSFGIGESIASGEGLEEDILLHKKKLYQTDEIQTLFAEIAAGRESRYSNVVAFLLKAYTSSGSTIFKRTKVESRKDFNILSCNQPGLILFGTSIPEICFNAITPTLMMTGLGSRCLFIEGNERTPLNTKATEPESVPQELIDIVRYWSEFTPPDPETGKVGNLSNENPTPLIIPMTNEATSILSNLGNYADKQYKQTSDAVEQVLWTRVYETACKLALIYACSTNHEQPTIDENTASWASEFTTWIIKRMIWLVNHHVADSPFAKLALRTENIIRKRGGTITRSDLSNALHIRPRELDEVIQKLTCDEKIEFFVSDTGLRGPGTLCYRMTK
jgi:hypothetical protein